MDKDELIVEIENIKKTKGRINIIEVANLLGIKVYQTKNMTSSSFIAFDGEDNCYKIYVNEKDAGTRQRFSIAHEIAHYLLHKDLIQTFGVVGRQNENSLSIYEEKKADELAGCLLMPENSVHIYMQSKNKTFEDKLDLSSVKAFAQEFQVSLIAGALRLRELGYYVGYIEI